MKKLIIAFALLQSLVASAVPTVKRVVARQMWPWSTSIRIEYTLEGAEAPVDIQLAFKDGETPLSNAAGYAALDGDILYVGNGVHVITLDPVQAFGKGAGAIADFKVCVTPVATELPDNKVLYKIIDLDGATKGKITDVTRVDLLMGKWGAIETDYSKVGSNFSTTLEDVLIWTGVTQNEAYKTTKLVVRRIPAGTFMMGSPEGENGRCSDPVQKSYAMGETQHQVTLQKDYWIGVFPITQKQYKLITGAETAPVSTTYAHDYTTLADSDLRPVNDVRYKEDIRGNTNWPENHDVTADGILGKLRALVDNQIAFDLPTEAQWERACRGGNEGKDIFYSGKPAIVNGSVNANNRNEICWNYYNSKDPREQDDTKTITQPVGGKLPNAFGLYDMIGNVGEWVLDRCKRGEDYDLVNTTDPVGFDSATGDRFVIRGGAVNRLYGITSYLRSASRVANSSYIYEWSLVGLRVSWTEE